MSDAKSWIEERRAALAHVLKHPHPDPAAEWAQTALNALEQVLELHKRGDLGQCTRCLQKDYGDWDAHHVAYPCPTVQAIEGAINE